MIKAKYILILIISLAFLQGTMSQSFFQKVKYGIDTIIINQIHKNADKRFEGLSYIKAIDKYNKVIERGFSPDSLRRNLAISYFKIAETNKSEELFAGLLAANETMDIYYYAQSLKYNKKYDEADKWIEKYKTLKEKDSRGKLQFHAAPVIKDIYSKEKYIIEPVWFNSKYSDFGAVVSGDEIVFASGRNDQAIIKYEYPWKGAPYLDVYKTSIDKPTIYKEPQILSKGINSRFHDGPICFAPDTGEVFITRNNFNLGLPKYSNKKENHFQLYWAKRTADGWEELEELPFNSDEYSCGHPSISNDNRIIYFASDMPGGYGGSDIYSSERTTEGWADPINLGPEVNTEGDEMFPFISQKGDIYFSSNGHLGLGGLDIFMAREIQSGSYEITNMGYPLNSSSDDFSFFLLNSGEQGYFASNRAGGMGDDDKVE
jgi:tetratricopeptide (TPR) repeat protein